MAAALAVLTDLLVPETVNRSTSSPLDRFLTRSRRRSTQLSARKNSSAGAKTKPYKNPPEKRRRAIGERDHGGASCGGGGGVGQGHRVPVLSALRREGRGPKTT
ncbi:unnamed protein product [Miscanthus lutarioriparius]|uniref:Uncharacterized protein n=1 Tax=Miscanthus lutarioriparius TaxID=422564 RepID=A0A811RIQ3_9POAL|nr:unnamed protein product [Miscanthus lutarioriparius]